MAFIFGLLALAFAVGLYNSKGSYAYAWLSGECSHNPAPQICSRTWRGRRGW
jgi:hypothetical protein